MTLLWLLLVFVLLALPAGDVHALPWPSSSTHRGAIRGAIKGFKSYSDCVDKLARSVPASALSVTLDGKTLSLICRAHQAAAENSEEPCKLIGSRDYQLKRACQRFYAIYSGKWQKCPRSGYPSHHEGLCLALSTRQPALCRAAKPKERPLCEALLGKAQRCDKLDKSDAAACRAQVRAWRGLYGPKKPVLPVAFEPSFEARASARSAGVKLPAGAASFKAAFVRYGLLLADATGQGDALVINRQFAPRDYYSYRNRPPLQVELWISLASGSGGAASYTVGSGNGGGKITFRGGNGRYRTMTAQSGTVKVTRLERKLGGRIVASFSLVYSDGVDKVALDGRFETFVRELLPLKDVARYVRYRFMPQPSTRHRSRYSSARLSPDEVKRISARIRKVKENRYWVDPSVRDEIAKNTGWIMYGGSISRRYQSGGSYSCYRMYTVYRNSVLWLLGFRDNDVVCKVNRRKLDTPEDAYAAYGTLRRTRQLSFEVERGGKTITLRYSIRRVRGKRRAGAAKSRKKRSKRTK